MKRMLEILDELNQLDTKNGSRFLSIMPDITNVNCGKVNGHVTIGVLAEPLAQQMAFGGNKKTAFLIVFDTDEYNKLKNS